MEFISTRQKNVSKQCLLNQFHKPFIQIWECYVQFYFFSQFMCVCSVTQLCLTLCDSINWGCQTPLSIGFYCKNIGVGCHFLLQGSFQPRDWTCISGVSYIGKQILYLWATWKVHYQLYPRFSFFQAFCIHGSANTLSWQKNNLILSSNWWFWTVSA